MKTLKHMCAVIIPRVPTGRYKIPSEYTVQNLQCEAYTSDFMSILV